MGKTFRPAIKWTGSKRSQLSEIIKYLPKSIDTYYEPFCGGASVLRGVMESDIEVNHYICSDKNNDLIELWKEIKKDPIKVAKHYEKLWLHLVSYGDTKEGITRKKEYYTKIRKRFNEEKNPLDFMFIMRTTTNGMPRYNRKGEFNNSFHISRNGIKPATLKEILIEWSILLNKNNVEFKTQDYIILNSNKNDFIYLDPPYFNTKGIYYGKLCYQEFWNWLKSQEGSFVLSFDGISGDINNTYTVSEKLYTKQVYIKSGNSSFKRILGKDKKAVVYESLYIK